MPLYQRVQYCSLCVSLPVAPPSAPAGTPLCARRGTPPLRPRCPPLYMSHPTLFIHMKKVRRHGIEGNLADWISNWLSHRRQAVVVDGKFSAWSPVTQRCTTRISAGVLCYLRFCLSMTWMRELKGGVSKFADDTEIGGVVDNLGGLLSAAKRHR